MMANYFRVPKLSQIGTRLLTQIDLIGATLSRPSHWLLVFVLSLPGDQRPVLSCWPGSGKNNFGGFLKWGATPIAGWF